MVLIVEGGINLMVLIVDRSRRYVKSDVPQWVIDRKDPEPTVQELQLQIEELEAEIADLNEEKETFLNCCCDCNCGAHDYEDN